MANIASALKEEIVRLARQEIRIETEGLKKAAITSRAEIVALKRRVAELEKSVARLNKQAAAGKEAKAAAKPPTRVRFSAKGLAALRQRLGLTAAEAGALLGVSGQTIYNWEAEKAQPRAQQLAAFAALRAAG